MTGSVVGRGGRNVRVRKAGFGLALQVDERDGKESNSWSIISLNLETQQNLKKKKLLIYYLNSRYI